MSKTAVKKVKKAKIMPAKKKIEVKPVDLAKQLTAELKKLGYTIEKSASHGAFNYDLRGKQNIHLGGIGFEATILPHCCGVKEAGDFCIDEYDYEREDWTKEYKTALELLIAIAFIDCRDSFNNPIKGYEDKFPRCMPIIFNSNGEDGCEYFEAAARKYLKGVYKLISTTINPGSGSTIKTYISQV